MKFYKIAQVLILAGSSALVYCNMIGPMRWAIGLSESLSCPRLSADLGRVPILQSHSVEFAIQNRGRSDIWLLGSETSCECSYATDLPMVIRPGETSKLKVVTTPEEAGKFERKLRVLTNAPDQKILEFSIFGEAVGERERPDADDLAGIRLLRLSIRSDS
jgi:hypothetical protein